MQLTKEQRAWLANLPGTITTADTIRLFREVFHLTYAEAQDLLGVWVKVKWEELA